MMRGNNSRNPGLRVIFACIICIRPCAYHLLWLQCLAVKDYKMRRPVAADNGKLIHEVPLLPFILAAVYASCLIAGLYLCQFMLCSGFLGLWAGGTISLQLSVICSNGNSGGTGGGFWRNLAIIFISSAEKSPLKPGIPPPVPLVMNAVIILVS